LFSSFSLLSTLLPSSLHDTSTTDIYTLSLHDALPISAGGRDVLAALSHCYRGRHNRPCEHRAARLCTASCGNPPVDRAAHANHADRKSTRLNSSHVKISYAVFCLKKKNKKKLLQNIIS